MSERPFKLSIVLLNYRGWRDTLACIDSLLRSETPWYRIVVCDNGSPDESLAMLSEGLHQRLPALDGVRRRWWPNDSELTSFLGTDWPTVSRDLQGVERALITLLDNQSNGGFAKGNNTGLRLLAADAEVTHFWLLNNDTEILSDTITAVKNSVDSRPDVDLWGATVIYHHTPDQVQALSGGAMNWLTAESRHIGAFSSVDTVVDRADFVALIESQTDYVLGASMLASRQWIEKVGLLNEQFFLFYEEADWALRGRDKGLRIGYAPSVRVFHKEGASIGTAPSGGTPFSVYNLLKSRLLFSRLHIPARNLPIIWARVLVQALKYLLKGHTQQSRACIKGALDGWLAR